MSEPRFLDKNAHTTRNFTSTPNAPRIPLEQWSRYKKLIALLCEESISKAKCLEYLKVHLDFNPTPRQFSAQLKSWNMSFSSKPPKQFELCRYLEAIAFTRVRAYENDDGAGLPLKDCVCLRTVVLDVSPICASIFAMNKIMCLASICSSAGMHSFAFRLYDLYNWQVPPARLLSHLQEAVLFGQLGSASNLSQAQAVYRLIQSISSFTNQAVLRLFYLNYLLGSDWSSHSYLITADAPQLHCKPSFWAEILGYPNEEVLLSSYPGRAFAISGPAAECLTDPAQMLKSIEMDLENTICALAPQLENVCNAMNPSEGNELATQQLPVAWLYLRFLNEFGVQTRGHDRSIRGILDLWRDSRGFMSLIEFLYVMADLTCTILLRANDAEGATLADIISRMKINPPSWTQDRSLLLDSFRRVLTPSRETHKKDRQPILADTKEIGWFNPMVEDLFTAAVLLIDGPSTPRPRTPEFMPFFEDSSTVASVNLDSTRVSTKQYPKTMTSNARFSEADDVIEDQKAQISASQRHSAASPGSGVSLETKKQPLTYDLPLPLLSKVAGRLLTKRQKELKKGAMVKKSTSSRKYRRKLNKALPPIPIEPNFSRTNSIASTVSMTPSNIIPIAYIPGIIRCSQHLDVPDVPDVPDDPTDTRSRSSTPSVEQHFFMPSRDSTWSDTTSMRDKNRISIASSLLSTSSAVDGTIPAQTQIAAPIPIQHTAHSPKKLEQGHGNAKNAPTIDLSTSNLSHNTKVDTESIISASSMQEESSTRSKSRLQDSINATHGGEDELRSGSKKYGVGSSVDAAILDEFLQAYHSVNAVTVQRTDSTDSTNSVAPGVMNLAHGQHAEIVSSLADALRRPTADAPKDHLSYMRNGVASETNGFDINATLHPGVRDSDASMSSFLSLLLRRSTKGGSARSRNSVAPSKRSSKYSLMSIDSTLSILSNALRLSRHSTSAMSGITVEHETGTQSATRNETRPRKTSASYTSTPSSTIISAPVMTVNSLGWNSEEDVPTPGSRQIYRSVVPTNMI